VFEITRLPSMRWSASIEMLLPRWRLLPGSITSWLPWKPSSEIMSMRCRPDGSSTVIVSRAASSPSRYHSAFTPNFVRASSETSPGVAFRSARCAAVLASPVSAATYFS
jgi:hypothetical protein